MLGVFYVQRKDMPSDGIVCKTFPTGGAGRLPGKPEQNAVPTKGDTMGRERIPATSNRTSYFFSTYRSPFQGGCGLFLFDTFLSFSHTDCNRIHYFHYGRACYCAGALFSTI